MTKAKDKKDTRGGSRPHRQGQKHGFYISEGVKAKPSILPAIGAIRPQCKKCIYRADPNGKVRGCDYILITGKMRPTKADDCKIGLDKLYQGKRKEIPVDIDALGHYRNVMSER